MKKILIVDDDVRLLDTTCRIVRGTGQYEVMAEDSGRRAVSAAATFKPDLVILDVMMPGMDGGEVASALRQQPATRNVPILFLTSLVSQREAAARSGKAGSKQYLAKPVDPQALCLRVAELLTKEA